MAKRKKQTKKKQKPSRKKRTTSTKKRTTKKKPKVAAAEVQSEEAKASDDTEATDAPKLDASELDKLMRRSSKKKTVTKKAAKPKKKATPKAASKKEEAQEATSASEEQEETLQLQSADETSPKNDSNKSQEELSLSQEERGEETSSTKESESEETEVQETLNPENHEKQADSDSEEEQTLAAEETTSKEETKTTNAEPSQEEVTEAKGSETPETKEEDPTETQSESDEENASSDADETKVESTEGVVSEESKVSANEEASTEAEEDKDEIPETLSLQDSEKDQSATDNKEQEEVSATEESNDNLEKEDTPSNDQTLSPQDDEAAKTQEDSSEDKLEGQESESSSDVKETSPKKASSKEEDAPTNEESPQDAVEAKQDSDSSSAEETTQEESTSNSKQTLSPEDDEDSTTESEDPKESSASEVSEEDEQSTKAPRAKDSQVEAKDDKEEAQEADPVEVKDVEDKVEAEAATDAEQETKVSEEASEQESAVEASEADKETESKDEAADDKVEVKEAKAQPKTDNKEEASSEEDELEQQLSEAQEVPSTDEADAATDEDVAQVASSDDQEESKVAEPEEKDATETKEELAPQNVEPVAPEAASEDATDDEKEVVAAKDEQDEEEEPKKAKEPQPVNEIKPQPANGISRELRPSEHPALGAPEEDDEEDHLESEDPLSPVEEPAPESALEEALVENGRLNPELLLELFQSPEQGVFLFHRRARRRLFLDKVGLNHKHPLPESPVHLMTSEQFLDVLKLEDPELYKQIEHDKLPEHVTILDQLSARRVRKTSVERIIWRYWSWLTVSEVMRQWDKLDVPTHELKALLGHTTFEEVRSYFVRERYLFFPEDEKEVVRNLVGYWGMMTYFAPYYRTDLFPSILPEVFDTWLTQQGLHVEEAAEKVRPDVPIEIPRNLPFPRPKPWIRWGLAEDKSEVYASSDDNVAPALEEIVKATEQAEAVTNQPPTFKATPAPSSVLPPTSGDSNTPPHRNKGMQEQLRQPSWGAMVLLGFLIGGGGIFIYFLQRLSLFYIREVFGAVGQFGGPHHHAAPSIDPYSLMFFVWGGLVFFVLAHLLDLHFQWRMFLRWRRDHYWATILHPDDQAQGRRLCQQHADIAWSDPLEAAPESTQLALWELTKTFVTATLDNMYIRVWGTILEAIPTQSLPFPVLERWIAHRKLAFHVYTFRYYVTKGQKARRRGNDLAALQAYSEALTYYKPLAEGKDRLWRRLVSERNQLQRRSSTLFGEDIPHMSSPSVRALNTMLLVIVLCALFLNTSGLVWSVFWGFVLYVLVSQLMDVQVANRGLLHFWRNPVWKRYLSQEVLEEGQRTCTSKTKQLLDPAFQPGSQNKDQPLYLSILQAAGTSVLWWLKVRLWGRFLTSLLFHWGRHPILLRFTAREIMRKQVFEYIHHLEWAMHEKRRGNDVEAAIQLTDALAYYRPLTKIDDPLLHQLYEERETLLQTITNQWLETHDMDEKHRKVFRSMLEELLDVPLSTRLGQQCAALLKTLQRSYLDKNRKFYTTQPFQYLMSLRRQPLERSLEDYGLVRSLHYLQTSVKKISFLPLTETKRREWEAPLFEALHTLEHKIREQFRPLMLEAMEEAGLKASNHREEIAQNKLCEELLDCIIKNGRFSFSDVRDVISRNDLRLQDPNFSELFSNDVLLRLDKQLEERFHEIYRESEIYLRLLQRVSNISFGSGLGRFVVKYVLLPFGGSAFILVFMASMIEAFHKVVFKQDNYHSSLKESFPIITLGVIIGLILHTETGRDIFKRLLTGVGDAFRYVFFDGPRWVIEREAVQNLIRHPKAFLWYRFVLIPLLVGTFFFGIMYSIIRVIGLPMTWGETFVLLGMSTAISYLLFLTNVGRAFWDQLAYRSLALWQQVKDRWVIGLFYWTIDTFRMLLHTLDYIIYRGDDLLRFHPDEGRSVIMFKAIGQGIWSSVAYLTRLIANLFVEPQVNPIKHFPVVTVSHKMISAATAGLIPWMIAQGYSGLIIWVVAMVFQLALPGLCGFLVWEFKENWKLFQANKSEKQAALVGSHGETMDAMLRRGFHSGTLPKIYEKLNKYVVNEFHAVDRKLRRRTREQLHHVEEALDVFVERELLVALRKRTALIAKYPTITQETPLLSPNHIDFFLVMKAEEDQFYRWRVRIELEGGLLVGSIKELDTPIDRRHKLLGAEQSLIDEDLENFLQKCGIRLLRGKLENWLRFYLRGFEVGVPGSVQDSAKAEYFIHKDEVRVKKSVDNTPTSDVVYRLDEKGRLYEPAPVVTLCSGDDLLPRPSEQLQLSGQYRVADLLSYSTPSALSPSEVPNQEQQ